MSTSKLRRLGDVTLDLEKVLQEMVYDHDLQWGEILGLTKTYLEIHCPEAQEEYEEGGHPEYYYGPRRSA